LTKFADIAILVGQARNKTVKKTQKLKKGA